MKSVLKRHPDHRTKVVHSLLPPPRAKSPERPPCLMAVMRCASSPIPDYSSGPSDHLSHLDSGP